MSQAAGGPPPTNSSTRPPPIPTNRPPLDQYQQQQPYGAGGYQAQSYSGYNYPVPSAPGGYPYAPSYAPPQLHPQSPFPAPHSPSGYPAPAVNYPVPPLATLPGCTPGPVADTVWYLNTLVPSPFAPSAGYTGIPINGYDPTPDAAAIRSATKGFGTKDSLLISTLVPLTPVRTSVLAQCFTAKYGKNMVDVLDSETNNMFKMGIHALAVGPLTFDAELVKQGIAGIGTNETLLTELLLGRSNNDLNLLKEAYRRRFKRDLVQDVKDDLSAKTERMFLMALNASRPDDNVPINMSQVSQDVETLYLAAQARSGTDQMAFCSVMINRSQPHLTAVISQYFNTHKKSLTKVIKSEFSGHMRAGLLHIIAGAKPKHKQPGVWRDAKLIDKAMEGLGTKDKQLVWRIVRAHWEPGRMAQIKEAYKHRTRKSLETRVASETSGSYKKLMVALVNENSSQGSGGRK